MYKVNYYGKTTYIRKDGVAKSVYHSKPMAISKTEQKKKRRRQAISLNTRITSFKQLVKTIQKVWYCGLRITFCLAMLCCILKVGVTQPQVEKVEAQNPTPVGFLTSEGFESAEIPAETIKEDINDKEYIKFLIKKHFGKDADNAIKIADCESDFVYWKHNGNAETGDDSWGIFQINRYDKLAQTRPPVDQLLDPEFNIKYAKGLFDADKGFSSSWTTCSRINNLK